MIFRYRPDSEDDDWEDNPASNAMAWASRKFWPSACATPGHWTSRLMDYLYTSCPCCLLFRGLAIGLTIGLSTQIII